ncbi:transcription factor TFIIE [Desulfurococcus mucosus]|uniref:Transcription factor E n=1 Tax=Desulfurococcus mucosus (strain ATCC 35584 / DSM 2162 / JCM 9187 / O7/1) TaxID=765177 RepID=E8R785_DESM0|nr:transcription factor TFIIE [Desulfurococcus mucosus]ADV65550.1 Transcription factor IIE (TFIIE), alpha subunit [Desulfurococcus mucosus DSM 2162]
MKLSKTARAEDTLVEEDGEVLEVLEDLVRGVYGEPGLKLLRFMLEHGYVAEELLTRDTGIKSNEGRRILQKMSEENIVVPGKLRTGDGVLHIWRLNKPGLRSAVLMRLRKAREKLAARLSFEAGNIVYECPRCGKRYTLDEAYVNDFICPSDGEVLVESNKGEAVRVLQESISRIDALIRRLERVRE